MTDSKQEIEAIRKALIEGEQSGKPIPVREAMAQIRAELDLEDTDGN